MTGRSTLGPILTPPSQSQNQDLRSSASYPRLSDSRGSVEQTHFAYHMHQWTHNSNGRCGTSYFTAHHRLDHPSPSTTSECIGACQLPRSFFNGQGTANAQHDRQPWCSRWSRWLIAAIRVNHVKGVPRKWPACFNHPVR